MARNLVCAVTILAVALAICADGVVVPGKRRKFLQSQTESTANLPELFGSYKMGHGFNALTGQSGEFPVVDWTYTGGQTWTSPTNKTYKVPDQTYLAPHTTSHTLTCQKVSTSFSDIFSSYESSYSFSLGVGIPGKFGAAVKYSHELAKTSEMIKGDDTYYGFSSYYSNYYSLDMDPAYMLPLGFQMKQALQFLPATINTSSAEKLYSEFVASAGTHYVTLGDFGGKVQTVSFLNKSFAHSHSTEQVASEISLTFSFVLYDLPIHGGFGHHTNRSSIHIAKWFKENAKTYNFWKGGNIALQHNTTQTEWFKSVPDNAGMVNATLMPLDRLVSDTTKSNTLSAYCKEYIKKQGNTKGFRYPN